jgi:hypothetical protein
VNIKAYADQSRLLQSIPMTLGRWMSTHPLLCDRILAQMPEWGRLSYLTSNLKAAALLLTFVSLPIAAIVVAKVIN